MVYYDGKTNDDYGERVDFEADEALMAVRDELYRLDPTGERWCAVVRHTYDVIYNGRESGRYRWDQLMKTEKTHFGTLFEIYAQREFDFADGDATDYRIAGHQVDAKWSQRKFGWMLPPEVFGELALVATGSDEESVWSVGLIRVTEEVRRKKANRDKKSMLNPLGKASICWLWEDAPLTPNVLLKLDHATVEEIFEPKGGTARLCKLFEAAEGMIVHRNAVETVAMQLDAQKRLRGNGSARDRLGPEGYLILSGAYHRHIAEGLGVTIPKRDEYISVRVVPTKDSEGFPIGGRLWRRATADDTIEEAAPHI